MIGNKYAADELALSFKKGMDKLNAVKESNHSEIKKAASDKKKMSAADYLVDAQESHAHDAVSKIDNSIKDMKGEAADCNLCGYAHDAKDSCVKDNKILEHGMSDSKDSNPYQAKDAKAQKAIKTLSKIANDLKKKGRVKEASVVLKTAEEIKTDYVLGSLNKVASGLKRKGKSKAASKVLKAAQEIKNEKVLSPKAASKKPTSDISYLVDNKVAFVISELGKIAGSLKMEGNRFAADMVEVTASEIKDEAITKAAKKLEAISGLKKMAAEAYSEGDIATADVIRATINNMKRG